jgi:branched-chain amino acid transport system permease protein
MSSFLSARGKPALGGLVAFVLFALAALLYATGGGAQQHVAIVLVINGVMVVGTQIFAGNTQVLSFGHIGLAAIAAYTSAILSAPASVKAKTIPFAPLNLAHVQLSVPLSILIAVALTTLIAALIGLAICRLHGVPASIVTFALLMVVNSVLVNWKSLTGGAEAFYGIPVTTTLWWALLALLVAVIAGRLFMHSRVGLRVRAAREDELAAGSMGVQVHRSRYAAWVLSAAFAALGGALLGHLLGAISPSIFFENLMFLQMAMMVLGGLYSVTGALLGTLVLTVISEAMRWLGDGPKIGSVTLPVIHGLSSMVYGAIILVVMIWWSGGFLDDREIDGLWTWFRRRRRKVAAPEAALATPAASAPAAPAAAPAPPSRTPILTVREASMRFAGLMAVDKASIEVYPGEIVGLIGPNGAGKTTLLNMISGLYTPTSGEINLHGEVVTNMRAFQIARRGVARTFQNIRLFPHLSVRENVETAARVAQQYRPSVYRTTAQLLTQFGLDPVADRKASTLPYGVQRQLEMARAAALGPDLLLLDEPAAGTNDIESMQLADSIRRVRDVEDCAIVLIDHDLPFVLNLCERIYVLDAGVVIAQGTPRDIQEDANVKRAYLGTRAVRSTTEPVQA